MIQLGPQGLLQFVLVVAAAAMAIIAAVFAMLLSGIRRGRAKGWLYGWTAFAAALAVEAYCTGATEYREPACVLGIVLGAVAALCAVQGAYEFVGRRLPPAAWTGWGVALAAAFADLALSRTAQMGAAEIALLPGVAMTCYVMWRYSASKGSGVQLTVASTGLLSLVIARTAVSQIFLMAQGRALTPLYWATEATVGGIVALVFAMGEIIALLDEVRVELEESNTALNHALEGLEIAAKVDPLTGLYNRYAFYTLINDVVAPQDGTVAMLDLVGLKRINDTYGHHAGDQALLAVARSLQSHMRVGDYAFRWGGDEFVAVFFGARPGDVRERVALIARPGPLDLGNGQRVELHVSWGIAAFVRSDPDTAIVAADHELYRQRRATGEPLA